MAASIIYLDSVSKSSFEAAPCGLMNGFLSMYVRFQRPDVAFVRVMAS